MYSTDADSVARQAQRLRKKAYDRIRENHGLAPIKYKERYVQTDADAKAEADGKGCSAANPEQKLLDHRQKVADAAAKAKKARSKAMDVDEDLDDEESVKSQQKYTVKRKKPKSDGEVDSDSEGVPGLSDDEYADATTIFKRKKTKMHAPSSIAEEEPRLLVEQELDGSMLQLPLKKPGGRKSKKGTTDETEVGEGAGTTYTECSCLMTPGQFK